MTEEKRDTVPEMSPRRFTFTKWTIVLATTLVMVGFSQMSCSGNTKVPVISSPEGKDAHIDVHNHNIHDCHQIHKLDEDSFLLLDATQELADFVDVTTEVLLQLNGNGVLSSAMVEQHEWVKTTMVTSLIDSNIDLAADVEKLALDIQRRADNDSSVVGGGLVSSTDNLGGVSVPSVSTTSSSSTPIIDTATSSSTTDFFPQALSLTTSTTSSSTTETTPTSETTSSTPTTSETTSSSSSTTTEETATSETSTTETTSSTEASPSPSTTDTVASSTSSLSSSTGGRSTVTISSTRTSTSSSSVSVSSSAVVSTFSTLDNGRTIVVTQTSYVSTTPTASSSNLSSGGLSNTNKIVVGVVVGVGGSIIIGIIAVLFYIKSRKKDDYQSAGWTFWRKGEKGGDDDFLDGELGVRDRNINQGSNF